MSNNLLLNGSADDSAQTIVDLHSENLRLKGIIERLESELVITRTANAKAVQSVRLQLEPLYLALKSLFGEMDKIPGSDMREQTPLPNRSKAWDLWKQKLGGKQAEFIQALLDHGEMSATQLKIVTRSGQQTVYDTIHKLNKAGLINKNGGKFSLKEI